VLLAPVEGYTGRAKRFVAGRHGSAPGVLGVARVTETRAYEGVLKLLFMRVFSNLLSGLSEREHKRYMLVL
jgi:tRNA-dihydrouridine synthase